MLFFISLKIDLEGLGVCFYNNFKQDKCDINHFNHFFFVSLKLKYIFSLQIPKTNQSNHGYTNYLG